MKKLFQAFFQSSFYRMCVTVVNGNLPAVVRSTILYQNNLISFQVLKH